MVLARMQLEVGEDSASVHSSEQGISCPVNGNNLSGATDLSTSVILVPKRCLARWLVQSRQPWMLRVRHQFHPQTPGREFFPPWK